ncbi:MAG: polyphosphate kinase 2 family protein [Parcubacteria group bacterium]|nr:polyphosphate kinase 2 family protein [Parcubacteria group bacterium]
MNQQDFIVPHDTTIRLKEYDPDYTGKFTDKKDVQKKLSLDLSELQQLQEMLYAQNEYGVLIIFQAIDAAGKDSTIKYVMSGLNPQGCSVTPFKAPSPEELDHDYLWRCAKELPKRGNIGIFNRSYYEEVLVVRVHSEFLQKQQLPKECIDKDIWQKRYEQIRNFEKYLTQNGIVVIKFFLYISKEEQKKRFLERINRPEKNWKFEIRDIEERKHWEEYMQAYEEMLNNTSTKYAPWYIIPANHKWFARIAVADIIVSRLEKLKLQYPVVEEEEKKKFSAIRKALENEK